ncbi:MAG: glycerol-3-phosphate 1-O-acyltransferase PlsY [Thermaerobacterales bacterium]
MIATPAAGLIILTAAAWLIGSVPFGYLAGRWQGIDIRSGGSGNIGATNVLRLLGPVPGAAVLLLDVLKGAFAVALAGALVFEPTAWFQLAAAVAVIAGHCWTPFLRFKGGKGVATTAGALLYLVPEVMLIALGAWLIILLVTRIVSVASMAGTGLAFLILIIGGHEPAFQIAGGLAMVLVWTRHRENVRRLLKGTEARLGAKPPSAPPAA